MAGIWWNHNCNFKQKQFTTKIITLYIYEQMHLKSMSERRQRENLKINLIGKERSDRNQNEEVMMMVMTIFTWPETVSGMFPVLSYINRCYLWDGVLQRLSTFANRVHLEVSPYLHHVSPVSTLNRPDFARHGRGGSSLSVSLLLIQISQTDRTVLATLDNWMVCNWQKHSCSIEG